MTKICFINFDYYEYVDFDTDIYDVAFNRLFREH